MSTTLLSPSASGTGREVIGDTRSASKRTRSLYTPGPHWGTRRLLGGSEGDSDFHCSQLLQGVLAQLEERPVEARKVTGSNPVVPAGVVTTPYQVDLLPALKDGDSCPTHLTSVHAAVWCVAGWVPASLGAASASRGLMLPPRAFRVSAGPAATMMLRSAL